MDKRINFFALRNLGDVVKVKMTVIHKRVKQVHRDVLVSVNHNIQVLVVTHDPK